LKAHPLESRLYIPKTKGGNELNTFKLELTGEETSSLEELLKSIKVYEGKCEDDTRISFLFGGSYFTIARAKFATNVVVPRVRTMP
jgi:hypothetical protein